MPTILEALENALFTLANEEVGIGTPVYDDLAQAITQLKNGDSVTEKLKA